VSGERLWAAEQRGGSFCVVDFLSNFHDQNTCWFTLLSNSIPLLNPWVVYRDFYLSSKACNAIHLLNPLEINHANVEITNKIKFTPAAKNNPSARS